MQIHSPSDEPNAETPRSGAEVLLQIVNSLGDLCQLGAHALQKREAEVAWLEERIRAARSEREELAAFTEGLQKLTDYLNDHLPLLEEASDARHTSDVSQVQEAYEAAKSQAEELSQELEMTVFERDSLFEELQERSKALAALEKQAKAWATTTQDEAGAEAAEPGHAADTQAESAQSTAQDAQASQRTTDAALQAEEGLNASNTDIPHVPTAAGESDAEVPPLLGLTSGDSDEGVHVEPAVLPLQLEEIVQDLNDDEDDDEHEPEAEGSLAIEPAVLPLQLEEIIQDLNDDEHEPEAEDNPAIESAVLPLQLEEVVQELEAVDAGDALASASLEANLRPLEIESILDDLAMDDEDVEGDEQSDHNAMTNDIEGAVQPIELEPLAPAQTADEEKTDDDGASREAAPTKAPVAPAPLLLDDLDAQNDLEQDDEEVDGPAAPLIDLPRNTRVQALPALLEGKAFSESEMRIASVLSHGAHTIDEISQHLGIDLAETRKRLQTLVNKGWAEILPV